jgi:hypothetical protein
MNEAESKLRGGKAPSRSVDRSPSLAQPHAPVAPRPSLFKSFFGGSTAAVATKAGAAAAAAAGGSGSAAHASRASTAAEEADMARRKAEAEARRQREQRTSQLPALDSHIPPCSLESHASDFGVGVQAQRLRGRRRPRART